MQSSKEPHLACEPQVLDPWYRPIRLSSSIQVATFLVDCIIYLARKYLGYVGVVAPLIFYLNGKF